MSNPSKAKGTRFEVEVVEYLKDHGYPHAERRTLAGKNDKGDISGFPCWVFEVKNCKTMDLAGWMTEGAAEAGNAGVDNYAVIHKRRSRSLPWSYVTLTLENFVELLRQAGY